MPDMYDKAIAYLKEHPDEIKQAWNAPWIFEGGPLFAYCTPDGRRDHDRNGTTCGCLTQIRSGGRVPRCVKGSQKLTKLIQLDEQIPDSPNRVTVDHLERFAYWQRRLDAKWPERYATISKWRRWYNWEADATYEHSCDGMFAEDTEAGNE